MTPNYSPIRKGVKPMAIPHAKKLLAYNLERIKLAVVSKLPYNSKSPRWRVLNKRLWDAVDRPDEVCQYYFVENGYEYCEFALYHSKSMVLITNQSSFHRALEDRSPTPEEVKPIYDIIASWS